VAALDPEAPREVTVVADPAAARTHEIRNLLARNGVPHAFHSCQSDDGRALLRNAKRVAADAPVVILANGSVLDDPSNTQLAQGYRVPTELERHEFEVVVIGAGPAGLAAAVYASSEGLDACSWWSGQRSAAKRAPARGSGTTSASLVA
jgi:thioredoxin reductase (NADPH)